MTKDQSGSVEKRLACKRLFCGPITYPRLVHEVKSAFLIGSGAIKIYKYDEETGTVASLVVPSNPDDGEEEFNFQEGEMLLCRADE